MSRHRVVWITGRPASGKTTLGRALVAELRERGRHATLVDSDDVRAAITPKATYSAEERALVYRAIAYVARRLGDEGVVPVVAATAHEDALRRVAREVCGPWFLIYARCSPATCEARDPKGLYRKARARDQGAMPGVHVEFEEPLDADLVVDTDGDVDVRAVVDAVTARG
jgi:adenylylsulfate kinase